jgi:hypothetical protein
MEKKYIHNVEGIKCCGFEKSGILDKMKRITLEPGLWFVYSLQMDGSDDGSIDFELVSDIEEITYDDGIYLVHLHGDEAIEVMDFCIVEIK